MENNLKVPAKLHVPKRTAIAIKKTSLLIDELELRREKEAEFKLTPAEVDQYLQLKEVFKTQRPAEKIESAIEARKEFLTASKIQRDREEKKENTEKDSLGMLLLAAGTPVALVGITLLDTFMTAGIGVIAAGAAMYVPAFIKEVTKKRKARKELRNIEEKLDDLSNEIDERSRRIDKVCSYYGIPINCTEKQKYMVPLYEAAKEFERLEQKETDYELLLQLNGSESISSEISKNLNLLSGTTITDEERYKETLDKLEKQLK